MAGAYGEHQFSPFQASRTNCVKLHVVILLKSRRSKECQYCMDRVAQNRLSILGSSLSFVSSSEDDKGAAFDAQH